MRQTMLCVPRNYYLTSRLIQLNHLRVLRHTLLRADRSTHSPFVALRDRACTPTESVRQLS